MITIYGMPSCPDCQYVYRQLKGREADYRVIDIGADVASLKPFVALRDADAAFDPVKAGGHLGIPCFVLENGSVTFKPEEAGLSAFPAQD